MFVILIYDVNEKRCAKLLKICRKYLIWVQNSVFEGDISESNLFKLELEIGNVIVEWEGDSVFIYKFTTKQYLNLEILGNDKRENINFI